MLLDKEKSIRTRLELWLYQVNVYEEKVIFTIFCLLNVMKVNIFLNSSNHSFKVFENMLVLRSTDRQEEPGRCLQYTGVQTNDELCRKISRFVSSFGSQFLTDCVSFYLSKIYELFIKWMYFHLFMK